MFTVNETADKLNVSKVTIYAKLKKHADMVVMKQGQKYITDDLFNLIKCELNLKNVINDSFTSAGLEDGLNEVESIGYDELVKQNNILINTLLKQLEIKDNQIAELQEIIKVNNRLIENNQVLLKNAQQQDPVLLQEHLDNLDKKIQDVTNKMENRKEKTKGFFDKFKWKK